jgi:ParB-like chromosome segregation protein Spo0J
VTTTTLHSVSRGHPGPVEQWNLCDLRPATLNGHVYRPVLASDPAVKDLAASIRAQGLLDPILVTQDRVIISGHRRHCACGLAGLYVVPVRVWPVCSTDPKFTELLVSANKQRVKSMDEILREELALRAGEDWDSECAIERLREHRRAAARVDVDTIEIEGSKRRCKISPAKQEMLDAVLAVLRAYREFLPVTVRRVHYALLNDPPRRNATGRKNGAGRYANGLKSYKDLSDLLTRARHEGLVPWSWIIDPTRPVTSYYCHANLQDFIREELDDFLVGYQRDYLQSQPNHFELVGEKLTLDGIIKPVLAEYQIRVTVGRGYSSYSKLKEMANRFRKSGKQNLVVLFLDDFDPEGDNIPHAFVRNLRDDHKIPEGRLRGVRVALTVGQVAELELPEKLEAKKTSSRYKAFSRKYGDSVHELEAVPPETLQEILRSAVESVLDMELFNAEREQEAKDAADLERIRRRAMAQLGVPEGDGGIPD